MNKQLNNPQAFPLPQVDGAHSVEFGMTLRDYFAASLAQGDAASEAWSNDVSLDIVLKRCRLYYQIADIMLQVREE